ITNKFNDPQWYAPNGADLQLSVRSRHAGTLLLELDHFTAKVHVKGGLDWQRVTLAPGDFSDSHDSPMKKWGHPIQFTIANAKPWHGPLPVFRNLRWIGGEAKP
ncbi:MAG: hypothetical protein HKL96_02235, partial [Phycisphaerales bacterium]|nr:hypothetical protein [Phycisphaerales bacterium]